MVGMSVSQSLMKEEPIFAQDRTPLDNCSLAYRHTRISYIRLDFHAAHSRIELQQKNASLVL